jgi:chromosome partitioning protein
VMEVDPGGRSAVEVEQLWSFIYDRLEKNFRRTIFSAPTGTMGQATSPRVGQPQGFGRRVVGS